MISHWLRVAGVAMSHKNKTGSEMYDDNLEFLVRYDVYLVFVCFSLLIQLVVERRGLEALVRVPA